MFINYYIKSKVLILKIKLNLNDEVNNDKIVIQSFNIQFLQKKI